MELGYKIIRWVLVVWTAVDAVAATALLLVGVLLTRTEAPYDHVTTVASFIIFNAVCYLVLAVFGFWGALRKNHCMLYTYAVMALVLLLAEMALAVYMHFHWPQMKVAVEQNMQNVYNQYSTDLSFKLRVDDFQRTISCCGSMTVEEPWSSLNITPPASCYPDVEEYDTQLVEFIPDDQEPHEDVCIPMTTTHLESLLNVDPYEIALLLVDLGVTLVLALLLLRALRRDHQLSLASLNRDMFRL